MNSLLQGWDEKPLAELAHINMGQSPDSSTYNDNGKGIPFLQGCGDFGSKYPVVKSYCSAPNKVADENALLISVRAPVGKLNIADQRYCIGRGLAAIRGGAVDSQYLSYLVELNVGSLQRLAQGSTFEAIGSKELNELKLTFPTSEKTRRKIAKILTTIDNLIDKTEALIDKYTQIKQGMMADLFTRGIDLSGTSETNSNYGQLRPSYENAPELYKETELGWVPKEWDVFSLGDIADVIDPQPDHRTPPENENGIPYVGVGDFYWDQQINKAKCRKVIHAAYAKQRNRFQVEVGDTIFGKIGTIGQPKQLQETEGFALSANILLIKADKKNGFIYSFFSSDIFNKQLNNIINTTSQPALGIQTMRNIKVACPCSESEISAIELKASGISSQITENRKLLEKYYDIKKGLMQDLLTGKVEVKI